MSEVSADPWIFGYGSLMWRPDFPFAERHPAVLRGYHRAFCRYSFHHRGTRAAPGMVLGLARGGACLGIAYRLRPEDLAGALAALDKREGPGYDRRLLPVALRGNGKRPAAWVYVPDPTHDSYAHGLSRARAVELIGTGSGASGRAADYLRDVVAQLKLLDTPDPRLEAMLAEVEAFLRNGGVPEPRPQE